jgi:broad specificity phosphatase PhoE
MRMRLAALIPIMILSVLAACATPVAAPREPLFYVVRHLNTPEGQRDPDLTAEGSANAQALLRWFEGKPLSAIYISDYKRTRQTAGPIAAARGLMPKIYDPADTPKLVAAVRAETGPVLIVGHSNTVPDIVEQLGGTRPAPLAHPDFGDIWTVGAKGSVKAKLR